MVGIRNMNSGFEMNGDVVKRVCFTPLIYPHSLFNHSLFNMQNYIRNRKFTVAWTIHFKPNFIDAVIYVCSAESNECNECMQEYAPANAYTYVPKFASSRLTRRRVGPAETIVCSALPSESLHASIILKAHTEIQSSRAISTLPDSLCSASSHFWARTSLIRFDPFSRF